MTGSWFGSGFFCLAFLMFAAGIYFVRKRSGKENGIVWLPLSIVLAICANAFLAGIINLARIPVNILSVGAVDFILAVWLWWLILAKNRRQQYEFALKDGLLMLLVAGVAILYGVKHFGLELTAAFQAIDAPHHYANAMNVVNTQRIASGMFFSDLYDALFIETFSVFFKAELYYKIFVLSEMVNLLLAGTCFCAIVMRFAVSWFMRAMVGALSLFYLFGYPVHNLQFGFVYWGMSVTILTCMLYMLEIWVQEDRKWILSVILALLNFGLFESYSLFVPPVFLGEFLYIVLDSKIRKRIFTAEVIGNGLIIFLPAVLIGLVYSYSLVAHAGIGAASSASATAGIANEGEIYKSFYSDFIVLLPFALSIYWNSLRKKRLSPDCALFICMALFMLLLLLGGMVGKVSSYYYCKNNYVIWLLLFFSGIRGIFRLWKARQGQFLVPYFITWGMVFLVFYASMEERVIARNPQFSMGSSRNYFSIYAWNREWEPLSQFSDKKMELFCWVNDHLTSQGESVAICSDSVLNEEWYRIMTNTDYQLYFGDWDLYLSKVEPKARYICVMYDNFYYHHQDHFTDFTTVYESELGYVAKIR
ncbi:MAG: hypothetical protein HFH62_09240 [Lachnospiraceae bacterium]|nr:hypothetical protein [Lachnospiraceae bacterium]